MIKINHPLLPVYQPVIENKPGLAFKVFSLHRYLFCTSLWPVLSRFPVGGPHTYFELIYHFMVEGGTNGFLIHVGVHDLVDCDSRFGENMFS